MHRMKQVVTVHPGYDRRPTEGMHGAEIEFALIGQKGTVTFCCYTDWLPKGTQEQYVSGREQRRTFGIEPAPLDFAFHSPVQITGPMQPLLETNCMYTDSGICYGVISRKIAEYIRDVLLEEGSDGVWRELATRYRSYTQQISNARKED